MHYSESDCIALLRCASMAGYPALRGLPRLGKGENPNLALFFCGVAGQGTSRTPEPILGRTSLLERTCPGHPAQC